MNYLKRIFSGWFPVRKEYLVKRIVDHPILFGVLSLAIALLEVLFIVSGLMRFDFSKRLQKTFCRGLSRRRPSRIPRKTS